MRESVFFWHFMFTPQCKVFNVLRGYKKREKCIWGFACKCEKRMRGDVLHCVYFVKEQRPLLLSFLLLALLCSRKNKKIKGRAFLLLAFYCFSCKEILCFFYKTDKITIFDTIAHTHRRVSVP